MQTKLYAGVFIAAVTLLSCAGGNDKDYIDESLLSPAPSSQVQKNSVTDSSLPKTINLQPGIATVNTPLTQPINNINLSPGNNTVNLAPPNNTTPPIAHANAGNNLNPAHGQPGHRCDISVGAPLNSKPAAKNTVPATVSTTPPPVSVTAAPLPQKVAVGINPPHGQPGHRCDISVGAPLNSKPAPPVTTQTVQPANTPPVVAIPVITDSSKN
jgi:hypothetical protein